MQSEITIFRAKITIIAILVVILILSGLRLVIQNGNSTGGAAVVAIQEKIEKVKKENLVLQNQIYSESSYTTIGKKAKSMGFRPATPDDYIYLK